MNTTLKNTLACSSFISLTDLLSQVQAAHINLTIQVRDCPDLCSLAWGSGNPDLSGVGVSSTLCGQLADSKTNLISKANISWIFQAVLTILMGPGLPISLSFVPSSAEYLEERLQDLHRDFLNASIFITLPVSVATIVYLKQVEFLFEVTFLYYLTTMQFLALIGTALAGLVFAEKNLKDVVRSYIEQSIITALSCTLSFGLYLGSLKWTCASKVLAALLPELLDACQAYGKIVPSVPSGTKVTPYSWHNPTPARKNALIASSVLDILFPFLYFGIGFIVCWIIYSILKWLALAVLEPFYNMIFTLAFSIGTLFCLVQMQAERDAMRAIAGPDYGDDKWGFGQVISVFVWLPIAFKLLLWILELLLFSMRK